MIEVRDLKKTYQMGDETVAALAGVLPLSSTVLGAQVPRLYFVPGRPLNHYLSRNTRSVVHRALGRITAAAKKLAVALSVRGLGTGTVLVGIHIAAPGLALQPASAIDQVATSPSSTTPPTTAGASLSDSRRPTPASRCRWISASSASTGRTIRTSPGCWNISM